MQIHEITRRRKPTNEGILDSVKTAINVGKQATDSFKKGQQDSTKGAGVWDKVKGTSSGIGAAAKTLASNDTLQTARNDTNATAAQKYAAGAQAQLGKLKGQEQERARAYKAQKQKEIDQKAQQIANQEFQKIAQGSKGVIVFPDEQLKVNLNGGDYYKIGNEWYAGDGSGKVQGAGGISALEKAADEGNGVVEPLNNKIKAVHTPADNRPGNQPYQTQSNVQEALRTAPAGSLSKRSSERNATVHNPVTANTVVDKAPNKTFVEKMKDVVQHILGTPELKDIAPTIASDSEFKKEVDAGIASADAIRKTQPKQFKQTFTDYIKTILTTASQKQEQLRANSPDTSGSYSNSGQANSEEEQTNALNNISTYDLKAISPIVKGQTIRSTNNNAVDALLKKAGANIQ